MKLFQFLVNAFFGIVLLSGCAPGFKNEKEKRVLFSGEHPPSRCDFKQGQHGQLVLLGKVALAKGALVEKGIYINNGIIRDIGDPKEIASRYSSAQRMACKNAFFSPGLINAHEHTSFSYDFPNSKMHHDYIHRDEWRENGDRPITPKAIETSDTLVKVWVELRHLLSGSTTVAGSGGVSGVIRNINSSSSADFFQVDLATFPFGMQVLKDLDASCETTNSASKLSSPALNTKVPVSAPYVPHVGEGRNCVATKEVDAYLAYVDKNPLRKYSMIHGVMINETHYSVLNKNKVSVIWSPRSNVALYGVSVNPIPLIDSHISVAMGTDWSPSGSFNMFEEMRCGKKYTSEKSARSVTDEELWEISTINGAVALGVDDKVGSIAVGKVADIIVVDDKSGSGLSGFSEKTSDDILAVFIDGKLMAGDRKALSGEWVLASCGTNYKDKFICIDFEKDYQQTFEQIFAKNAKSVDLLAVDGQAKCEFQ